jgi:hypothetical protein
MKAESTIEIQEWFEMRRCVVGDKMTQSGFH